MKNGSICPDDEEIQFHLTKMNQPAKYGEGGEPSYALPLRARVRIALGGTAVRESVGLANDLPHPNNTGKTLGRRAEISLSRKPNDLRISPLSNAESYVEFGMISRWILTTRLLVSSFYMLEGPPTIFPFPFSSPTALVACSEIPALLEMSKENTQFESKLPSSRHGRRGENNVSVVSFKNIPTNKRSSASTTSALYTISQVLFCRKSSTKLAKALDTLTCKWFVCIDVSNILRVTCPRCERQSLSLSRSHRGCDQT
eukprot:766286-Hanusia_phi.AAC.1